MAVFFTKEHEWISVDGSSGTLGITDYAAHQLGDITFVELPKIGKEVKKGAVLCAVESVKAASDIYSPLSGKVAAVNHELDASPQLLNESPESTGWIAKLDLTDPADRDGLMTKEQYDAFVKGL